MSKLTIPIRHYFRWKILLLRIPVNAVALLVTAILMPNIYFVQKTLWAVLLLAVILGVINAIIKPIVQVLTLPFLFASYGLVIVLVNALILLLVSWLFPSLFGVTRLFWALVGGVVFGICSSFLENLLGLMPPIHPEGAGTELEPAPALADRLMANIAKPPAVAPDITAPENPESQPEEVIDAKIDPRQD